MKDFFLSSSMMCANFENLKLETMRLDQAGIDKFHIDIMDGHFVSNYGMGLQDIEVIKKNTKKPLEVHLMVKNAIEHIDLFKRMGADIIYVHYEGDINIAKTLIKIKQLGLQSGLVINPGTSVNVITELFSLVDFLLVMTVNPGYAGQDFLEFTDEKIKKLVSLKKDYGFQIVLDGAVSEEKIEFYSNVGVDGFILGTSALFNKSVEYKDILCKLRKL